MTSGDIALCDLNPAARRGAGRRPPLTTRNRDLEHHIGIPADSTTGLKQASYAMTEQVRAISAQRVGRHLGRVSNQALTAIRRYLHLFIA